MTPANHTLSVPFLRARGIQYATQTRFQSPTPVPPWNNQNPKNATWFGPDCIQAPWYEKLLVIGVDRQAEDCLYLNVWAPMMKANTTEPLPVLFWIHGGSFTFGGSSTFNPEDLYGYRSVIIVTVNYRLGGLGWLGGDAVQHANHKDGSSGNFGLQDTRAALNWVQRNIGTFGGDPKQVTIYGESAGASIVAVHLVAPRSKNLFASAIMESGPFDNFTVQANATQSFWALSSAAGCGNGSAGSTSSTSSTTGTGSGSTTGTGSTIAANAGASAAATATATTAAAAALTCLKQLPLNGPPFPTPGWNTLGIISALATTSIAGWFGPTVDGVELSAEPEVLAKAGEINKIVGGVIIGTNLNEGQLLLPLADAVPNAPDSTLSDLKQWMQESTAYYQHIDVILKEYQFELKSRGPWQTACRIYTESQYLCPSERSAKWLLESNQVANNNIRLYRLTYEASVARSQNEFVDWFSWCKALSIPCSNATKYIHGVGHGADIPLVWYSPKLNKTDVVVARQMVDYWQNFAVGGGGNPNFLGERSRDSLQTWPTFAEGNATLLLDLDSAVGLNVGQKRCAFWDALHPL